MNFFRNVVALSASFQSYRQIRDTTVTASVKYLLKLIVLLALALTVGFVPLALERTDQFAQRFDAQRPEFRIQDGHVVSDAKQPAFWGNKDLAFMLDTTGKVTEPNPQANQGVLITANALTLWAKPAADQPVVSRTLSLRGYPDGEVDGTYLSRLVRMTLWVMTPLLWAVLVLVGLLGCLMQAYLFSIVAARMEQSMPAPLQLPQLLNIAIHACTPAAILVTIYVAMRVFNVQVLPLIYLAAYSVFLIGATNACRDKPARELREDEDWL